jgi:hypothetical protein
MAWLPSMAANVGMHYTGTSTGGVTYELYLRLHLDAECHNRLRMHLLGSWWVVTASSVPEYVSERLVVQSLNRINNWSLQMPKSTNIWHRCKVLTCLFCPCLGQDLTDDEFHNSHHLRAPRRDGTEWILLETKENPRTEIRLQNTVTRVYGRPGSTSSQTL